MADFANPFSGMEPGSKINEGELIRALRLDLAAEEEAVHLYMAHAEATDNALAKKVLTDVANEERVHAGEFLRLIQLLTGDEDKWLADGAGEVNAMAAGIGPAAQQALEPKTIGSLKE
ncbi:MAG: Rubrerythrin [Chloroflexi bacterium]|nr:Rubrerythrin [Chloroflexota bacterium]